MKKKILKFIFSIGAGFGLTVLLFIGLMYLLVEGFELDEDTVIVVIVFVMGTLVFATLSAKVYDSLKKE